VMHDHYGPAAGFRLALQDRVLLRGVDAYLTVTEPLRDRAQALLALPAENCVYLRTGVPVPDDVAPLLGPPVIVQIANLHWPKAHTVAVCAAAIVRQEFPDLRWICVGRFEDRPQDYVNEVRSAIESRGLEECVLLAGPSPAPGPQLARSSVGVLTSDAEGLPITLLEYMAAGLPVVVTDVGQCREVVTAACAGYVVPPRDPESLAKRVIELLRSRPQAACMGASGRSYVERVFSLEAMVGQVVEIYRPLGQRPR
jgi:glycosyltransferase involved in cell wall biosynthesis